MLKSDWKFYISENYCDSVQINDSQLEFPMVNWQCLEVVLVITAGEILLVSSKKGLEYY